MAAGYIVHEYVSNWGGPSTPFDTFDEAQDYIMDQAAGMDPEEAENYISSITLEEVTA